ncbi:MAG: winged helix-turn-helix domain-containing protein [Bdellovibrionaceae bacterium]|nr:winged helix-turn-helix domain-containing protein [Pseudobdellovibrionaceae bacterium]
MKIYSINALYPRIWVINSIYCRKKIGWGSDNLVEPLIVTEEYQFGWAKPIKFNDFNAVARLQKEQGMTYEQLAKHFNLSLSGVQRALRKAAQAQMR